MLDPTLESVASLIRTAFPLGGEPEPSSVVDRGAWEGISEKAVKHGLGPLLYGALKACGRLGEPPSSVVESLRSSHLKASVSNWLALEELARWLECFRREHIPAMPLKGAVLAVQLYPEIGFRPFSDLDLMIPFEKLTPARNLLLSERYIPFSELGPRFSERFGNVESFSMGGTRPRQLDLHWHLFGVAYFRRRIPIEWFWQRTEEVTLNGQSSSVFTPTAQLVYLSGHSALHHNDQRLIWSYDLALLLARLGHRIDWDEVIRAASAFRLQRVLQATLAGVGETWGITPPEGVMRRLEALHSGIEERVVYALATGSESKAQALFNGLYLPGIKAKLSYWRWACFPQRSFMEKRFGIKRSEGLARFYVRRGMASIYRMLRRAGRMISG